MRQLMIGLAAIVVLFAACPAFAQSGKAEPVGAQREVQAISVSLKTGWRGKKEVSETYGPPQGFVIVEHRVDLKKKDGNANYSISILPDKFTGITTEEVKSTYSRLADAAAKLHLVDYEVKLKAEQQELLKRLEFKSVSSSVISVKASIEGSGELDLVVYAKIANVATNVSLSQVERLHMANLDRLAANPKAKDVKNVLCAEDAWLSAPPTVCEAPSEAPGEPKGILTSFPRFPTYPAAATTMPAIPPQPPAPMILPPR